LEWEEAKKMKGEVAQANSLAKEGEAITTPSILQLLDPSKITQRKEASKAFVKAMEADLVRFLVGDVRTKRFYTISSLRRSLQAPIPSLEKGQRFEVVEG
jgi:hypothetical protein